MDETYPILLSGEARGTLTVAKKGLFTEFDARFDDLGRLIRLSVYGGGREGYLGVAEPEGGALRLRRRFSRAAMNGFPEVIEFAAEAGRKPPEAPAPNEAAVTPARSPEKATPEPEEPNTDLLWYRTGDGSLVTTWEGRQYRAIPMAAWGLPLERALERRTIDGVEYAVFAVDSSRIQ